jgi:preprotein translocase subunit SecB
MTKPTHHDTHAANEGKSSEQEKHGKNPEFAILRIYTKDLSFESPNSPACFKDLNSKTQPTVDFNVGHKSEKITDGVYDITLKVAVNIKNGDKTTFLVELQQAGIFTLNNFTEDQLKQMQGAFCPNILYPYAREIVSDLVGRGTFPPFYLPPINFDDMYRQQLAKEKTDKE